MHTQNNALEPFSAFAAIIVVIIAAKISFRCSLFILKHYCTTKPSLPLGEGDTSSSLVIQSRERKGRCWVGVWVVNREVKARSFWESQQSGVRGRFRGEHKGQMGTSFLLRSWSSYFPLLIALLIRLSCRALPLGLFANRGAGQTKSGGFLLLPFAAGS